MYHLIKKVLLICVVLVTTFTALAADPELNIVPWPQSLTIAGGQMSLTASSRIVYSDTTLSPLANILASEIEKVTLLQLPVLSGSPSPGDIYLVYTADPTITDEEYKVTVAGYATVEAENYNAVAMGSVTILQAVKNNRGSISIPEFTVIDGPDAGYRSLMVDVARNNHSIETLKEMVTMCRLYKIRYMQIHLSDDQGMTFPSTAYPAVSNWGSHLTYTLPELYDLVAFADNRGVILIPEIDVPAHAMCFTKSMPELFASPTNGVINFADEAVWDALGTIINEVCDVFQSSPYFHLGADEANIWGLSSDPEFQAAFTKYGVDGIEGLFNYFISHLDDDIKSQGKSTIVWEGFNYGKSGNSKMDTDVSVMMFDNYKHPQSYLNAGYKVINASWYPLYIVGASAFGVPSELIYNWDRYKFGNYTDPYPRRYDSLFWKNVSVTPNVPGAQMCSWEMPEENEIPSIRFRIAPFSDRIWNPANTNGYDHFDTRYESTDEILDYILADHQPPTAPANVAASMELYLDKIRVGWAASENYPRKYALYRNTVNNASTAALILDNLDKTAGDYEDYAVVNGQTYYYWLKAWNKWGWSSFSAVGTGKTGISNDLALAYEPFDYADNVPIDGKDGGVGFSAPWNLKASNGPVTVIPDGLSYPGLLCDGGAVKFTNTANTPSMWLSRQVEGYSGHDMSVVWFSFLIKPEKVADGHAYIHLNGSYDRVGVGKKWVNGFGFNHYKSVKLENNKTYFVVARYDCRSGNDISRMWINPSLDQEPELDSADILYTGGSVPFGNSIDFGIQGYGNGIYVYDEIRLGSTWQDVTSSTAGTLDPPAQAAKPFPEDAEIDVSVSPTLQWTSGQRAVSHDVYFGTDPVLVTSDFIDNRITNSYTPPELDYDTTYYWRIDEVNAAGTTQGATWVFTTGTGAVLMHHWTFDEAPGSTTAADSIGGITIDLNGGSITSNGKIGNALYTNSSRVTSGALGTTATNGYSIAFWVKASQLPNTTRTNPLVGMFENNYGLEIEVDMLRGTWAGQNVEGVIVYHDVDRDKALGSKIYASCMSPDGLFDVPDDDYIHIVVACDGIRQDPVNPKRMWVNAIEQPLTPVWGTGGTDVQLPTWQTNHILHIGYNTPWEPSTHDIGIDDLRLYDGMLAQSQIDALYSAGLDCDLLPDLNNDCEITMEDFAWFASKWIMSGCTTPDYCGAADFDKNGVVDIDDLAEIVKFWLQ